MSGRNRFSFARQRRTAGSDFVLLQLHIVSSRVWEEEEDVVYICAGQEGTDRQSALKITFQECLYF